MESEKNKTILIYRTGSVGDMLVSFPAIEFLHRANPDCRLVLITDAELYSRGSSEAVGFLISAKWIDSIINYHPVSKQSVLNGVSECIKLTRKVRQEKASGIICLSQDRQTASQLMRLSLFFRICCGIGRQVGFKPAEKTKHRTSNSFASVKNEYIRHLETACEYMKAEVPTLNSFNLNVPEAENINPKVDGWISKNARFISVVVGSKMPAKRWPAEKYKLALSKIADKYPDINVIFLGSQDEKYMSADVAKALPAERICDLTGLLTLSQSAHILKKSLFYFGNDTGAMHLAALLDTKCFAIFSARDYPNRWNPIGTKHTVFRSSVTCEGCFLEECIEHEKECLVRISPDDVFDKIESYMQELV